MSDAKHTPGPWETWGDDFVIIRKLDRVGRSVMGKICSLYLSPRQTSHGPRQGYPAALEERAANARLIAAAPTMLDALKLARAEIAWWVGEHGCCAGKESESLAQIDAAIALAEGGGK